MQPTNPKPLHTIRDLLAELLANTESVVESCTSTPIFDSERLKSAGKRCWQVSISGTLDESAKVGVPIVPFTGLSADWFGNVETSDGSLSISRQAEVGDDGLTVVKTTIKTRAENDTDAGNRAIKVYNSLPLPPGFLRQFFELSRPAGYPSPVPATATIEVVDKQSPLTRLSTKRATYRPAS